MAPPTHPVRRSVRLLAACARAGAAVCRVGVFAWGAAAGLPRRVAGLRGRGGGARDGERLRGTADALGRRGERAAVRALRRAGYRILATRWRSRHGEEVDVVALDGDTLVVVEVKSTTSATEVLCDRVDFAKRKRLRAAAAGLLRAASGPPRPVRIDVVEVRLVGRRAHASIRPAHARLS